MTETASLLAAIDSASIIDKVTGFNISKWAAEGEVTIQLIHRIAHQLQHHKNTP